MSRKRWDAIMDRLPKDRKIIGVEVGVWYGKLSVQLLTKMTNLHLIMVDAWRSPEPGSSFARSGAEQATLPQSEYDLAKERCVRLTAAFPGRATVLEMDSVQAAEYVRKIESGVDFVFIDADHSYDGVKADIEAWIKVRPKRWIGGHDYANKRGEVKRAVDGRFNEVDTDEDHCWFVDAKGYDSEPARTGPDDIPEGSEGKRGAPGRSTGEVRGAVGRGASKGIRSAGSRDLHSRSVRDGDSDEQGDSGDLREGS